MDSLLPAHQDPRMPVLAVVLALVVVACGQAATREPAAPAAASNRAPANSSPVVATPARTISMIDGVESVTWSGSELTLADHLFRRAHPAYDIGGPTTGSIDVPAGVLLEVIVKAPTPAMVAWANASDLIVRLDCRQPVPRELEHLRCELGDDNGDDTSLDDAALGAIAALPALQTLDVRNHRHISPRGLAHLATATRLRRLDLEGNALYALRPDDLDVLATLPALAELSIANNDLGSADLGFLGRMPRLEALNLIGVDSLRDASLAVLADLPELRSLELDGTPIGDAGLAHLAGLPRLERLELLGTQVSDAGLAHLRGLRDLAYVDAVATQVTAAGCAALDRAVGRAVCKQ